MNCLETCILVLVIGFTVMMATVAIIQKIFDENRKKSERIAMVAEKRFDSIIKSTKDLMGTIIETTLQKNEEAKKKRVEEFLREYSRMKKGEFED